MHLSVLDQSPVRTGGTPAQAIEETITLAQAAESLGYTRYWLAEHHATDGFAGSAPEIMVARVAAATNSIRVGSGGVMLSHYSPFKVAEMFRLLEVMHPGRIDLGIGRAPGSDQLTAAALAYGSQIGIEYFPTKVADLRAFLAGAPPATQAFQRLRATPAAETPPEMWILGSSDQSALLAAHFGLPFSYAHFINPSDSETAIALYRERYKPSEAWPEPVVNIGVFVICADSDADADHLAKSRDLWRLRLDRGALDPIPSVEESEAYPYTHAELARVAANRTRNILGSPDTVREALTTLASRNGIDEIIVLTITYDFESRLKSYALLAEAFALKSDMVA